MTTAREAILENSRLARMRQGQAVGTPVEIPSMREVRVLQVPLTDAESAQALALAAAADFQDHTAGLMARNLIARTYEVWASLREMDAPDKHVFENVEEMQKHLEPGDIEYLANHLVTVMAFASPAADGVTDEMLDALKKAFGEIELSALTGSQWAAMRLCFEALFPTLLRANSFGSSSTESSTEKNDESESTSDADTS